MPQVPTVKPNGKEVRRIRKERGITPTGMARKLGRHPQSIWNIEGNSPRTSEVFMRQIAAVLDVDMAELIREPGDDEPESVAA